METDLSNIKLNEQQLQMLQLFKNPMPEKDFLQLKRLAVQLLAKNWTQKWNGCNAKKGGTKKLSFSKINIATADRFLQMLS